MSGGHLLVGGRSRRRAAVQQASGVVATYNPDTINWDLGTVSAYCSTWDTPTCRWRVADVTVGRRSAARPATGAHGEIYSPLVAASSWYVRTRARRGEDCLDVGVEQLACMRDALGRIGDEHGDGGERCAATETDEVDVEKRGEKGD
uniref:Barwin domain-containing protein n=1 Tax=Oryza punctata TaxID=4537 RepID=A0A0E0MD46_ORYPU